MQLELLVNCRVLLEFFCIPVGMRIAIEFLGSDCHKENALHWAS